MFKWYLGHVTKKGYPCMHLGPCQPRTVVCTQAACALALMSKWRSIEPGSAEDKGLLGAVQEGATDADGWIKLLLKQMQAGEPT